MSLCPSVFVFSVFEVNIKVDCIVFFSVSSITELFDDCARPGKRWAVFAATTSYGISRRQVHVDRVVHPLGRVVCRGLVVGCLSKNGALSF